MSRPLQSESIDQVLTALAGAQAKFPAVAKHGEAELEFKAGRKKYRYADLSDVIEAVRAPLSAAGLVITSTLMRDEEGMALRTWLAHTSGQWLASYFPIEADPRRPQDVGSGIAYGRRYNETALLDIATEDDDGAAAQGSPPRRTATTPAPPSPYRNGYRRPDPDSQILADQDAVLDVPGTGRDLFGWARDIDRAAGNNRVLSYLKRLGERMGWPMRVIEWTDEQAVQGYRLAMAKLAKIAETTPLNGATP